MSIIKNGHNLPDSNSTMKSSESVRNVNAIRILGSTINMVNIDFILSWIQECIEKDKINPRQGSRQLLVTGFHGLNQAFRDPHYFQIGEECDLWVPDSIAPVIIARKRGMKDVVRTPGPEILSEFLRRTDKKKYSSYFYGDSPQTLAALRKRIEQQYPEHRIAGTFSPPFRPLSAAEEQDHIDMINDAKPDVVWVGLGLPKQDEWIYRCKDRLKAPVTAGVGAAFGFLAGTTERAPQWVRNINMEWAYMVIKKPKRTGKRVFVEGGQFVFSVLKEELSSVFRS